MTLKLRAGISTADVEYGTALLDEDGGEYWNLNPTGSLVLQTLLSGGTADEAAQALVDEYGIDAEAAARDVHELIEALHAAGLVDE
ncbi:MAG: lasso peptide biosynthesis PqqD family chaperone [Actinomycetota bacterium]|nr:lasso peptide biosynthesis PqqD family chaperone [Actinomycetota bacterium]